jgi:HSP20 family protein
VNNAANSRAPSSNAGRESTSPNGDRQSTSSNGDRERTASNGGSRLPTFIPPTDIVETKDALLLFLDMPGADPSSLDVTLNNRELTVAAEGRPTEIKGYTPVHSEYREGNYERRFVISEDVDDDHVEATFSDGTLRLRLPKAAPATKKIPVKAN